jgi:DNA-binding LytR/AlgR family response regulator
MARPARIPNSPLRTLPDDTWALIESIGSNPDPDRVTHFYSQDRLHTSAEGKTYCIDRTIAELEEELGSVLFVRVHRGALLNLDWLDELTPFFGERPVARLKDEKSTEIIVSRDRVHSFKERLGI